MTSFHFDAAKELSRLHRLPAKYWIHEGERHALSLFHEMAIRVPAYKDFLRKHHIDHTKIRKIKDFTYVPLIDKKSYLRHYPRKALCWDGVFRNTAWVISATSGSTGEPFYFPRTKEQDQQYARTAELYLRNTFAIHKRRTLYIIGFPMGVWIGGIFTYQAMRYVTENGKYNMSIITTGISKQEIIKAVKNVGGEFDQILIGSYAPFLKDILDDAISEGVEWKRYRLGFLFSAEVFSETFRDYIIKKTGITNPYLQTLNHYGTVDLGTMAHETPLGILIRRLAVSNNRLYVALFKQSTKLPTLAQYRPKDFYFEEIDHSLICSARSGIPLVRYDLKDSGGIFDYESLVASLTNAGVPLSEHIKTAGISHTIWRLPFVYVYERKDFSVSFFAFQIYPETIRRALQTSQLEDSITGKFTMKVYYNASGEQIFEVNIESKARIKHTPLLISRIKESIVNRLLRESSEYHKTHELYGARVHPRIIVWPYEHETYFKPGIKQKRIFKNI